MTFDPRELVGTWPNVRIAGADPGRSEEVHLIRRLLQSSLYWFMVIALGREDLSQAFHEPVCDSVQNREHKELLLLLARDHCKSSIVSQAFPLHVLTQEPDTNIYFPGEWGCEQRILIIGSGEGVVSKHMQAARAYLERSPVLRTLFPDVCWPGEKGRPPSDVTWNDGAFNVPRQGTWPDKSVAAISLGGHMAGKRPSVAVFDDVIGETEEKSNVEMDKAKKNYAAADALLEEAGLQRTIMTPWTPDDLVSVLRADEGMATIEIPAIDVDGEWRTIDEAFARGRPVYRSMEYLKRRREKWRNLRGSDTFFSLQMMLRVTGEGVTDFAQYAPYRAFQCLDGDTPWDSNRIVFEKDERDASLEGLYVEEVEG